MNACIVYLSVTAFWSSDLRCGEKQSLVLDCYGAPYQKSLQRTWRMHDWCRGMERNGCDTESVRVMEKEACATKVISKSCGKADTLEYNIVRALGSINCQTSKEARPSEASQTNLFHGAGGRLVGQLQRRARVIQPSLDWQSRQNLRPDHVSCRWVAWITIPNLKKSKPCSLPSIAYKRQIDGTHIHIPAVCVKVSDQGSYRHRNKKLTT